MEQERTPTTAQTDELYTLIRFLYPAGEAAEIIDAFAHVLQSHANEAERANVLQYWLDFYKLRKYQRVKQRRRPTYKERVSACSACGYPASHRHHLWDVANHGENNVTIPLCANCHELHHLLYNALARDSEYSRKLLQHMLFSFRIAPDAVEKLLGWCRATIRYEAKQGWLDAGRADEAWIEARLNWSAYQEQARNAS